MSDQQVALHPGSLPRPVLDVLSVPGVNPAKFWVVLEAFGPLSIEGQRELAGRLINARGQYLAHRRSVLDRESTPERCRNRLKEIANAADLLLHLLHRDGLDLQHWNRHPAIDLALHQLFRIASENHPTQIWDHGLGLLVAMLADIVKVGAEAEKVFPRQFPKTRGGKRRTGLEPASALVEHLIEIYAAMRTRYDQIGSPIAFGKQLVQFVRAGLEFSISTGKIWLDGTEQPSFEASFVETNLAEPTRITDDAIRGVYQRWRARIKIK